MSKLKLFGILTICTITTLGITATLLQNQIEKYLRKIP